MRLWDVRTPNRASITFEEQDSEVNDLCCSAAKHRMLVVAGGTLAVYDTRKKGTLRALSDEDEDEKLAVALCKAGKKVAVGTQMGVLSLFSWGHFEDCSDRCMTRNLEPELNAREPYACGRSWTPHAICVPLDTFLPEWFFGTRTVST